MSAQSTHKAPGSETVGRRAGRVSNYVASATRRGAGRPPVPPPAHSHQTIHQIKLILCGH